MYKYIGVYNGYHDDDTLEKNMTELKTRFGL